MSPAVSIESVPENSVVSGFVLAGGLSSRMGRDKNFVEIDGQFALDRQCRLIQNHCPGGVSIVTGANFRRSEIDWPVVVDLDAQQGPLGGIVSALDYSMSMHHDPHWILIIANDLWSITGDDIERLVRRARLAAPDIDVLYVGTIGSDGVRIDQPLCSLWRSDTCLTVLKRTYESGQRSVMQAWESLRREIVLIEPSHVINYNSPEDISRRVQS